MMRSRLFGKFTMFTGGDVAALIGYPNGGKTAMVISECIYMIRQNSGIKVLYITTETTGIALMTRMLQSILVPVTKDDNVGDLFKASGLDKNITISHSYSKVELNTISEHYDIIIIDTYHDTNYDELHELATSLNSFIIFTSQITREGYYSTNSSDAIKSPAYTSIEHIARIICRTPDIITFDIKSGDKRDTIEWQLDMSSHYISPL